jgi:hypothetical protein
VLGTEIARNDALETDGFAPSNGRIPAIAQSLSRRIK